MPRATGGLVKHGFLLLAATQVANACNILFQAAMGRLLPASEYGVLLAMLGIALIVVTPLQAITNVAAHYTARLVAAGRTAEVASYVVFWVRRLALPCLVLVILTVVGADRLQHFFHLASPAPIRLTLTAVALSVFVPLFVGTLQGLQRFVWMATVAYAWAVVRLAAGVPLAMLWQPTAMAGLWAQAAGVLVSVAAGVAALLLLRSTHGQRLQTISGVHSYLAASVVVLSGFALLTYLDVPLIKHYFPDPGIAGVYSRASVIGRAAFFLPMPVAQAMFPKVTSAGSMDRQDQRNLLKAIVFTVVLTGTVAVVVSLWPALPLGLLFGDFHPQPYPVALTRAAVWAMAPLSLLFLLLNFQMAQHRFAAALIVVPAAAVFILGTFLWHRTPFQVLFVLGGAATASVAVLAAAVLRAARRAAPDGTPGVASGHPAEG